MHHAFRLDGAEHNVALSRARRGYRLHLTDGVHVVDLAGWEPGRDAVADGILACDGAATVVSIAVRGDDVFVHLGGDTYHLHHEHPLERLAHQAHGSADDEVRAPMPGSLVAIQVGAGAAVVRGQTLLVMESMKMETAIAAPRDGVVQDVRFGVGQPFERDAVLLTLAPAAPAGAGDQR